MNFDEAVGRRVEALRVDAGLSQEELSERLRAAGLNWSQGTLSRVETGGRPVRFAEAITLAAVLGVDLTNLTPTGGGLTFAYHRRVQMLEDARGAHIQATHTLNVAVINAQLFRLALELSQGSQRPYTLHIAPSKFLSHLSYQIGPQFPLDDLFRLLGADGRVIKRGFDQVDLDISSGLDPLPAYAPRGFSDVMDCYSEAEPGTDEHREKMSEARYLLEQGMVDQLFIQCFPNVEIDLPETPSEVIIDWPTPVVDGIDTTDLEQPVRYPPVIRGAHLGR